MELDNVIHKQPGLGALVASLGILNAMRLQGYYS